jgi:DNA uptake protein ComE-like DNA-binding protein
MNKRGRRSFVMIAVLVVVGSALLVATSLLFLSQERVSETVGASDQAQARALAWSGVRVVVSQLNDQRERILQGELPRLDPQYTIYETRTRLGIVRLLPVRSGSDQRFSPEAGKLDLNSINSEGLARTGLIDTSAAAAIIAHRDQTLGRPFQSVVELLNVPGAGISLEKLFGPIEKITPRTDAQMASADVGQRILARLDAQSITGLADVMTVFSVEPSLQFSGKRRINLNVPWSDDLSAQVAERFGQPAADMLKKAFDAGAKFDTPAKLIQAMLRAKIAVDDWPQVIDAFATDGDEYHFGLLDINTAPQEALLSLPGVTAEQAAQMVRVRQELSAQERASIAWPVISQIIKPEAFDQLAGRITTRCWTYRVRLAAGEVDAEHPDSDLKNPLLMYEAVIDLSAPKPRVAYLRDITVLQETASVAAQTAAEQSLQFASSGDEGSKSQIAKSEPPPTSAPDLRASSASRPEAPMTSRSKPSTAPSDGSSSNPTTKPASHENPNASTRSRIGRWLPG